MITIEQLHKIFYYNPKTGIFKWRTDRANSKIKAGTTAGYLMPDGYITININKKSYLAHRLAWFYVHGYFPENQIDHKNRIKDDNRIENLREVTFMCQARNRKLSSNNSSGIKGISFYKLTNRWRTYISINQKVYGLGYYKDFDDAVCARLAAEQCLKWSGCDSSSPAYKYVKENIQRRLK